ncbi:protein of unknown function (plasmid) [Caballeronia sp. S22]
MRAFASDCAIAGRRLPNGANALQNAQCMKKPARGGFYLQIDDYFRLTTHTRITTPA